jgi:hypothetical protein
VFSVWSVLRSYNQDSWGIELSAASEAETSCGVFVSGQRREHRRSLISIVKIRYQETATESVCSSDLSHGWISDSVVPSRVYKWSINPFTNPNPACSYTVLVGKNVGCIADCPRSDSLKSEI